MLNPHTVSDLRQINSILRKGGGTVTNQKILRSKPKSCSLAIGSAVRGGHSGPGGKEGGKSLEASFQT